MICLLARVGYSKVSHSQCVRVNMWFKLFFYVYYHFWSFHSILYYLNVFIVSFITWIFFRVNILFDWSNHFFYLVFNTWDSSMSCIMFVRLASEFPIWVPKFFVFSVPVFHLFGFFVISFLLSFIEQFSSNNQTIFVFIYFINEFTHILFKVIDHIQSSYFEVLVLWTNHIAF